MKHNWEYKPFKQLSDILYGCPFESEFFNSESKGMPLIRIRDVKPGFTSTYFNGAYSNEYLIKKGDYLIGMDGEFNIAPWQSEDALLNQRVCRVKSLNESIIISDFIYYFLGKELKNIEAQTSFVTVKHLSAKVLNAISTPVPPMEVQQQIVAELDKINEVIEDCRELLRNLDALAQSLFYDYFGDPITNPKTFPIVTLSDVFSLITDGTHQTPTYTTDIENGVKFLSAKDVVNGYIDWTKIKYIPFDLHIELHKRIAPQRGDILLCKNGTTGICALVETDDIFDIYVSLALLRPNANTCGKYLVYAINNPFTREQFNHSLKGIGVPNLHLNKIRATKIILPPLELQGKFAERVEQIDAQKKAVEETIANLQTLLDSRMDYWFN